MCISINIETANEIAKLLNYVNVSINKSVEKDKVNNPPNQWIEKLIRNKSSRNYPHSALSKISSLGGVEFTIFSKSHWLRDIPFDTTLRQHYKDTFYVRTWIKSTLASKICEGPHHILNVNTLTFDDEKSHSFPAEKEHSKLAVSQNRDIICFADLNHTLSQKKRGGNIICFENKNLAD